MALPSFCGDDQPPKQETVEAVAEYLTKACYEGPEQMDGALESDVVEPLGPECPLTGPVKAFVRCAFRAAAAAGAAKSASRVPLPPASLASPVPGATGGTGVQGSSALSLLGNQVSSAALAHALSSGGGPSAVDFQAKLKVAGITDQGLPQQVPVAVWQVLSAATETADAAVPAKHPFTFVNLTHKDFMLMWLPSENIGGHTAFGGEGE